MADEVAELQLFVEIVRAGNLSAAARALNSSPAAMSRGLTTLESRLGVRLVTRTSRSFELTEEGQFFYERCVRIVADIAERPRPLQKGRLSKGYFGSAHRWRLADGWSRRLLQSSEGNFRMFRFTLCCPMPVWM